MNCTSLTLNVTRGLKHFESIFTLTMHPYLESHSRESWNCGGCARFPILHGNIFRKVIINHDYAPDTHTENGALVTMMSRKNMQLKKLTDIHPIQQKTAVSKRVIHEEFVSSFGTEKVSFAYTNYTYRSRQQIKLE